MFIRPHQTHYDAYPVKIFMVPHQCFNGVLYTRTHIHDTGPVCEATGGSCYTNKGAQSSNSHVDCAHIYLICVRLQNQSCGVYQLLRIIKCSVCAYYCTHDGAAAVA